MTSILKVLAAAATLAVLAPAVANARNTRPDCDAARRAVQAQIDAACPCDGPGVHAEYVRCVTKKLRELSACRPGADGQRSCGPVPRLCTGKVRQLASRSACGKPATTVTCCIPKQRDCVGDSKPGDGTAEGTCSGTSRKCDRITECLVPKCEMAASAERCGLLGGTVGTGRDCSTACGQ